MAKVLVVDDDLQVQGLLVQTLRRAGHDPKPARDSHDAVQHVQSSQFELAIVDLRLPDRDGCATFRLLRQQDPLLRGILITGFPQNRTGLVTAMREGFCDYVEKPIRPDEFLAHVEAALMTNRSTTSSVVQTIASNKQVFEGMVGTTPAMRRIFDLIGRIAATDEPVLICGETGTGKELVARAIHKQSRRSGRPFNVVSCATCGPDSLVESEFFGHERGAFTGAVERTTGWFESSHGATLFLDEVSELSHSAQAKLLRAIEQHEVHRLGSHRLIQVDVRVIAATNVNLRTADVTFRRDLFHRLSALEIVLPPLRERLTDLPHLVQHLMPALSASLHRQVLAISDEVLRIFEAYPWPGNVRELQQELKKACLRCSGPTLLACHLSEYVSVTRLRANGSITDLREVGRQAKRSLVEEALIKTGGDVTTAARLLGVNRRTIHRFCSRDNRVTRRVTE